MVAYQRNILNQENVILKLGHGNRLPFTDGKLYGVMSDSICGICTDNTVMAGTTAGQYQYVFTPVLWEPNGHTANDGSCWNQNGVMVAEVGQYKFSIGEWNVGTTMPDCSTFMANIMNSNTICFVNGAVEGTKELAQDQSESCDEPVDVSSWRLWDRERDYYATRNFQFCALCLSDNNPVDNPDGNFMAQGTEGEPGYNPSYFDEICLGGCLDKAETDQNAGGGGDDGGGDDGGGGGGGYVTPDEFEDTDRESNPLPDLTWETRDIACGDSNFVSLATNGDFSCQPCAGDGTNSGQELFLAEYQKIRADGEGRYSR